ncbi:MAG: hypothetical protein AABW52_00640 [Nanoarchaeota archaeon]
MLIKVKIINKEGGIGFIIPKNIVAKMNLKAGEKIIMDNIRKEKY